MEFNIAKTRVLEDLIPRLSNLEKRVLMGVAKMGATLTELQSPIPVILSFILKE